MLQSNFLLLPHSFKRAENREGITLSTQEYQKPHAECSYIIPAIILHTELNEGGKSSIYTCQLCFQQHFGYLITVEKARLNIQSSCDCFRFLFLLLNSLRGPGHHGAKKERLHSLHG